MPASGGDPVASALRIDFASNNGKIKEMDISIEASAKRVLLSSVEYGPATNYQSSVLTSLKSKYIMLNTKVSPNNGKVNGGVTNGVNGAHNKADVSLPLPKQILFPPEKIQLGYRGNLYVGSGMMNLGNTCYLNSTLQALFHVPAFVNWLLSETSHQKCEQISDFQHHPDDMACAVIKTFKCSQQKTGSIMKPHCIYSKLKAICKHLSHGSQEDAHEFMRYLLESLEKNYLSKVQGHNLPTSSKETTPINQIFGGYIRTEVTCLICRAVSTTFQHFQDLPLDIRRASTLDDALAGYFERERLDGDDAYKCEKCSRKVPATKKFSVEQPPNVLCVQLKRFSLVNGKLTKQIQMPQYLDMTRFISPSRQPRNQVRYRLVSMVTHMGQSANCGHYTAIALAADGHYYQFDDGSVRQMPLGHVMNMSAYLVIYELERPFVHFTQRQTSVAAESASTAESESASVGGAEPKEMKTGSTGSPPAGSPAPQTPPPPRSSPQKSTSASLVPYESDIDSDSENKETEVALGGWKVTPVTPKPTTSTNKCTSQWRVTDVHPQPRHSGQREVNENSVQNSRHLSSDRSNGALHNSTADSSEQADKAICESIVRETERKRSAAVSELLTNQHRGGYGTNTVRTWNGNTSALQREVENERIENRKRPYDDTYNSEFDRGKVKKKRPLDFRRMNNCGRSNVFQQRANQNHWRNSNNYRFDDYGGSGNWNKNNSNNWSRRHYYRNHPKQQYNRY